MAGKRFKGFMGAVAAGSLLFGATAAAAQPAPTPPQISPWAALTILSGGAPAVATMCGAAVTAAQAPGSGCVLPAVDAPPPVATAGPAPVPPVEAQAAGYGFTPILLGLVAVASALGFYLLVKNHNNKANSPT